MQAYCTYQHKNQPHWGSKCVALFFVKFCYEVLNSKYLDLRTDRGLEARLCSAQTAPVEPAVDASPAVACPRPKFAASGIRVVMDGGGGTKGVTSSKVQARSVRMFRLFGVLLPFSTAV